MNAAATISLNPYLVNHPFAIASRRIAQVAS
jgi:hypothetical protein